MPTPYRLLIALICLAGPASSQVTPPGSSPIVRECTRTGNERVTESSVETLSVITSTYDETCPDGITTVPVTATRYLNRVTITQLTQFERVDQNGDFCTPELFTEEQSYTSHFSMQYDRGGECPSSACCILSAFEVSRFETFIGFVRIRNTSARECPDGYIESTHTDYKFELIRRDGFAISHYAPSASCSPPPTCDPVVTPLEPEYRYGDKTTTITVVNPCRS